MKSLIILASQQIKSTRCLIILVSMTSCYSYVPLTTQKDEVREVITNLDRGYTIMGRLENGEKFDGKFNFSDKRNIYLDNGKSSLETAIPIDQIVQLNIGKKDPTKFIVGLISFSFSLLWIFGN